MKPVNLRDAARGQPCMVRSPHCTFDTETTVLAHLRRVGVGGVGLKPPDLCAVWACWACHELLDGRVTDVHIGPDALRLLEYEALVRTLKAYDMKGWKLCQR